MIALTKECGSILSLGPDEPTSYGRCDAEGAPPGVAGGGGVGVREKCEKGKVRLGAYTP